MTRKSGKKNSTGDEKHLEGSVSDHGADATLSHADTSGKKKGRHSKDKKEPSNAQETLDNFHGAGQPPHSETKDTRSDALTTRRASKDDAQDEKDSAATMGDFWGDDESQEKTKDLSTSKKEATGAGITAKDTQEQAAPDTSQPQAAQKDADSSVTRPPDNKAEDVVRIGTRDLTKEMKETVALPKSPKELSAATSASAEIPLPENVLEAEKKFELADNTFVKSKDRAEELLKKSKELKEDTQTARDATNEAAAAVVEAKDAESVAQEALKEEVQAFLELGEGPKKSTSDVVRDTVKNHAAVGDNSPKKAGVTWGGTSAEKLDDKADKEGEGGALKHDEVVEEGKDKESSAAVPPPTLKVNPAHMLEYSRKHSSSRASLLAALAVVGLDTAETRAAVAAAESEASEAAAREAASRGAAAEKETQAEGALTEFKQRTLKKLEGNQQYVLLLHQRMQEEIEALQTKYDRLMEPVFDERVHLLLTGDTDGPDDQEGSQVKAEKDKKNGEGDEKQEKRADTTDATTAGLLKNAIGTRALPGFWLQAFSNHSLLASLIGQRDKPLLLYLQNVRRVFHIAKADGFSLIFEFEENPFFTPQTLIKTFRMKEEEGGSDWVVARTEGTTINWTEGMDVTRRVIMRKQLNMRTKSERMIKEHVNEKSFFNFFRNSVVPTDQEMDAMPEEEQTRLFTQLKTEYDAGVVLRDLIIPYALHWYLGTATEEERTGYESETEPETPVLKKESSSAVKAPTQEPPENTESSNYSFASWLGF